MFTQIYPFYETFGWKILVTKNPLGGLFGKSFSTASLHRNCPPSYGVPIGPSTSACMSVASFSLIIILTPT